MPRPKKPGADTETKKRSRNGCWPCKGRKVKCDETRPSCLNCQRQGETCDYSIRLNWNGRGKKQNENALGGGTINFSSTMISTAPRPRSTESGKQDASSDFDSFSYQDSLSTRLGSPAVQSEGDESLHGIIRDSPVPRSAYSGQDNAGPRYPSRNNAGCLMVDPSLTASDMSAPEGYQGNQYDQSYSQNYDRFHSPPPGQLQQAAISRLRNVTSGSVGTPSSTNSAIDSPSLGSFADPITVNHLGLTSVPSSFPTLQNESDAMGSDMASERSSKRARFAYQQEEPRVLSDSGLTPSHVRSYSNGSHELPAPPNFIAPPVPQSEDYFKPYPSKLSSFLAQENSEVRRLSVEFLLSGPPGMPNQPNTSYAPPPTDDTGSTSSLLSYNVLQEEMTTWGVDRGFKVWDIGMNDDANAISGGSPVALREHRELSLSESSDFIPVEFGFGLSRGSIVGKDTAFDEGGYYARPVTIKIPRSFEPLPPILLENPMNLLYFHHYINHTARILVPHHCSANPFQNILPVMALEDGNLMNLLLAYSAAHRARLLQQPEPATRIALYVQDIFPTLRHALDDPSKIVTNANLATAIMLASLEIISPKAFGVSIPWQKHLDIARQMIEARGGAKEMQRERSPVSYFLLRWFGYLDVLGSLVGGRSALSTPTRKDWVLDYDVDNDENDYKIDCLLGFTSRCVNILAKIAELAKICDAERIDEDHNVRPDWQPSEEIRKRAEKLIEELESARTNTKIQPCPHLHSVGELSYEWDEREMSATNAAFHWAGLVHIQRRILVKPTDHEDVTGPVTAIIDALEQVRKGSTAEACLLFPIFTAGCETQDKKQRHLIMDRFQGVEEWGMSQVHKAKRLMEKVWQSGKPWETLVSGEFVG